MTLTTQVNGIQLLMQLGLYYFYYYLSPQMEWGKMHQIAPGVNESMEVEMI
jgi:hypothetical protein